LQVFLFECSFSSCKKIEVHGLQFFVGNLGKGNLEPSHPYEERANPRGRLEKNGVKKSNPYKFAKDK